MKMNKNKAVLISDIHFSVPTLELASASLIQARNTAKSLGVPLIIAGDLLDSKAIIRAECANRLIDILSDFEECPQQIYLIVGNHDLINEKGTENSLNFLRPYVNLVRSPVEIDHNFWLIPYFTDSVKLQEMLKLIPPKSTLIMHQGVQTANMGHYVLDKTSLPREAFKDFRVVSGHYHERQTIKCNGEPSKALIGHFSYIGNPYTLGFGEADHPAKGFQVLAKDGNLTFVPTNLRRHVKVEILYEDLKYIDNVREDLNGEDLVWLKVSGTKKELESIDSADLHQTFPNLKLDLIMTDMTSNSISINEKELPGATLDRLIDALDTEEDQKIYFKNLWKSVLTYENSKS